MGLRTKLYRLQYFGRQWLAGRLYRVRRPWMAGVTLNGSPGHVLLVMTGLIGDTVMSTPVIVEARRLWPEAWITLLGTRRTCELLSACPLIDACIETSVIPFTLRKKRRLPSFSDG